LTKDEDGVLLLPDAGINITWIVVAVYYQNGAKDDGSLIDLQLAATATNGVAFIMPISV
jgi:hypothetical protein